MSVTKNQLATYAHEQLSQLATDAGLTTASYDTAISLALISVVGSDDVSLVTNNNLMAVIQYTILWTLRRLYNYYLTAVDFKLGPREEKLSQIAKGIQTAQTALGIANLGTIVFRDMEWTFNDFTAGSGIEWNQFWFQLDLDG